MSSDIAIDFLKLLLAAFLGGFLSYFLQRRAEAEKQRKVYVLSKLEESFHLIIESMEHQGFDLEQDDLHQRRQKLARAINTLELFADRRTRATARDIAERFNAKDPWVPYGPLAQQLRDTFRLEMGLDAFNDEVKSLHFYRKESGN